MKMQNKKAKQKGVEHTLYPFCHPTDPALFPRSNILCSCLNKPPLAKGRGIAHYSLETTLSLSGASLTLRTTCALLILRINGREGVSFYFKIR